MWSDTHSPEFHIHRNLHKVTFLKICTKSHSSIFEEIRYMETSLRLMNLFPYMYLPRENYDILAIWSDFGHIPWNLRKVTFIQNCLRPKILHKSFENFWWMWLQNFRGLWNVFPYINFQWMWPKNFDECEIAFWWKWNYGKWGYYAECVCEKGSERQR